MRIESKLFFVSPKKSLFNNERKPYLFVIAAARIATQSELSVRPFAQQDSASFLKPPFGIPVRGIGAAVDLAAEV